MFDRVLQNSKNYSKIILGEATRYQVVSRGGVLLYNRKEIENDIC